MKDLYHIKLLALTAILLLSISCRPKELTAQKPLASAGPNLYIPPLIDSRSGLIELNAQWAQYEFFANTPSTTMGYNGSYLGPSILLHRGARAQIKLNNHLGEATTLHSHGMMLPSGKDGGPASPIAAGDSWLLDFTVEQFAGTSWYHPHLMGSTASQVWQGLAGLYIINDPKLDELGLPSTYGYDDIPLVVQSRVFNDRGQMLEYGRVYNHMSAMMGVHGNEIVINGQIALQLTVPSGWIRLRLLNGSNSSVFEFALEDGANFYQIASDLSLLPVPQKMRSLRLLTGQRAEIMIDSSQFQYNELWLRLLDPHDHSPSNQSSVALSIAVDPSQKATGSLPNVLIDEGRDWESAISGARQRNIGLEMSGMMMMSRGYSINGQQYSPKTSLFSAVQGSYEVWNISSNMLAHSFHAHGVRFRILSSPFAPQGSEGWFDTVDVEEGRISQVLVYFPQPSTESKGFMLHCHMLEHEENGMMSQFFVN